MTHALFMAQQAANERLAAVEDEVFLEDNRHEPTPPLIQDSLAPPDAERPLGGARLRYRRNRSSQIIKGSVHSPLDSPLLSVEQNRRVSEIIGNHVNRLSLVGSLENARLSVLDEHRLSVLQTDQLLRHWTDQSDPLASSHEDVQAVTQDLDRQSEDDEPSSNSVALTLENTDNDGQTNHLSSENSSVTPLPGKLGRTPTTAEQRKSPIGEPPPVETPKSRRVGPEDPCYKVVPAVLKKYNIRADWRQYSLYVVYGDQERLVGLEEKPLALIKQLDKEGRKPTFKLRKVLSPIPPTRV